MKNRKWMAGLVIALGVGVTGASAQDWNARNYPAAYSNQSRVEHLRAEIARDQAMLSRNNHHSNFASTKRIREEMARDQRELNSLLRNTHFDSHHR